MRRTMRLYPLTDAVHNILRKNGIQRNTHSWEDYEFGKRCLQAWKRLTPETYQRAIRILTQYVGV